MTREKIRGSFESNNHDGLEPNNGRSKWKWVFFRSRSPLDDHAQNELNLENGDSGFMFAQTPFFIIVLLRIINLGGLVSL